MYVLVLARELIQCRCGGGIPCASEDGRVWESVKEGVDEMQADATVRTGDWGSKRRCQRSQVLRRRRGLA